MAWCLLVLPVLWVLPGLFAEDSGIRFRTLGWGVAPDDLYYSVDGRDVALSVFESVRSGFHAYPQGGEISLYRIVQQEDGSEERVVMARGDLRDAGPFPLIILKQSEAKPEEYAISVIPDDLTAFPEQTCRIVNFTPIDIGVTVGSTQASVPPGGIRKIDTHPEEGATTRYVTLFVKVKYETFMLSYNNWVFRPGQRVMVIVSVGKDGKPKVVRLVDAVAPLVPSDDESGR